mmetsp:Transcript_35200/g.89098  ORF Transcript_35200/g.89098 Transcript_35200/m.89098 type:complete len:163 (-) Transcript_35200:500-988(-)
MPPNFRVYKARDWARLARPTDERMNMLKTMVTQLVEHERICTTLAKAKALQRYADRLITLGKRGTRVSHEIATGIVRTDRELHKVFTTLALRYREREGGYTRVVPAGLRQHDAAPMAFIEFVDRPGELRPASRPWQQEGPASLLPPAAREYLRQQQQQAGEQ